LENPRLLGSSNFAEQGGSYAVRGQIELSMVKGIESLGSKFEPEFLVPISPNLCQIWQDFQRAAIAESSGIT
jgi:hypothetical protein